MKAEVTGEYPSVNDVLPNDRYKRFADFQIVQCNRPESGRSLVINPLSGSIVLLSEQNFLGLDQEFGCYCEGHQGTQVLENGIADFAGGNTNYVLPKR